MKPTTSSKITAERIRKLFSYDPETGTFVRIMYSKGRYLNEIISHDLEIDGEKHELSRFIWLHYYGEWPPLNKIVEHEDRNRRNNKLSNLRLASDSQNNTNKATNNQYGSKGIEFRSRKKPWTVRIWVDGVRKYIGSYTEFEEAEEASRAAIAQYHGEFACHD